jgi:hypothetical protein
VYLDTCDRYEAVNSDTRVPTVASWPTTVERSRGEEEEVCEAAKPGARGRVRPSASALLASSCRHPPVR